MLVVLDTNVLISALLSPGGPPAEIFRRWEADEFSVVTSPALLGELNRAFGYPKIARHLKQPEATIAALLKRFLVTAMIVRPSSAVEVVRQDPADNRVLECALAAGASHIITGDEHLLALEEHAGIVILRPAEFIYALNHKR